MSGRDSSVNFENYSRFHVRNISSRCYFVLFMGSYVDSWTDVTCNNNSIRLNSSLIIILQWIGSLSARACLTSKTSMTFLHEYSWFSFLSMTSTKLQTVRAQSYPEDTKIITMFWGVWAVLWSWVDALPACVKDVGCWDLWVRQLLCKWRKCHPTSDGWIV